MTFIDDWRRQIPDSLRAFASLITSPADVQLGLFAAAVLWPIREIATNDEAAGLALQQIVGDAADRLLALIRTWPDNPRAAAEDLAQRVVDDTALQVALTQLVSTMLAPAAATDPIGGAVTNFIVHIGDTISVADVTNANVNVKSSLTNVGQHIDDAASIDEDTKSLLRQMIAQVTAYSPPPKPILWKLIAISASVIGVASGIVGLYLGIPQILNPPRTPVPTIMLPPTIVPPPTSTPVVIMTGDINIAVAEFGLLDQQGHSSASPTALALAQSVYTRLDQELRTPNAMGGPISFIFDVRPPSSTGPITGTNARERAQSAARLASAINADVIVYGNLDSGSTRFIPEFYISDRSLLTAEELAGQYELGSPIDAGADITRNAPARAGLSNQLETRTRALAQFAIGLGYFVLDRYDDAGRYFQAAESAKDWDPRDGKEVLYLFLGSTDLVRQDWAGAQQQYTMALALNHEYARALIGLAEVQLNISLQSECQPGAADVAGLKAAIQYYQRGQSAPIQPALSDVPIKVALGLGRADLCLSQAGDVDRWAAAARTFQQVIDAYKSGNQRIKELAARAHFGLAEIYALQQNYSKAESAYAAGIELTRFPMLRAVSNVLLARILLPQHKCDDLDKALARADEEYAKSSASERERIPTYVQQRQLIGNDRHNSTACSPPTPTGN